MNTPPKNFVRVPVEQLHVLAEGCLKAAGMRAGHAGSWRNS